MRRLSNAFWSLRWLFGMHPAWREIEAENKLLLKRSALAIQERDLAIEISKSLAAACECYSLICQQYRISLQASSANPTVIH